MRHRGGRRSTSTAARSRAGPRRAAASTTSGFDDLVLATGAVPVRPPVPGIDARRRVRRADPRRRRGAARRAGRRAAPQRVVVVGGGYIGLEMAEALSAAGCDVTVVDRREQPMAHARPGHGRARRRGDARHRHRRSHVDGASPGSRPARTAGCARWRTGDGTMPADLVVLGLGVRPERRARRARPGIPLGAVRRASRSTAGCAPGATACGRPATASSPPPGLAAAPSHVALGTHANKQGRVAGINIGGGYATFPGVVGTAVTKVCDLRGGPHRAVGEARPTRRATASSRPSVDSTDRRPATSRAPRR